MQGIQQKGIDITVNKKILFCASSASHIELFHLPYINYFKSLGYEVHVATNKPVSTNIAARTYVLGFDKRYISFKNILTVIKLSKIIGNQHYDIVSSHATLAGMLVRTAVAHCVHRPVTVHTSHGYLFKDEGGLKNSLLLAVEKRLSYKTDLLVTMNNEDNLIAKKYSLCQRLRFVHGCGINPSKLSTLQTEEVGGIKAQYGISEEAKVILCTAEFSKRKNHSLLLEAFAQAVAGGYDINLMLAGDGKLKQKCIKRAKRLNILDRVTFCGYIKDMSELYSIADIVVSTSLCEGMPFNIMEALSKNIPVIASRIKGHVDLLGEGEKGILFSPDSASELKDCIIRLVSDNELYKKIKEKSHLNEEYYLKNAFKEMVEIYNEARNF